MRRRLALAACALSIVLAGISASASASSPGGGGGAGNFVTLDPITVPIIEYDRIAGSLQLTVVIDAKDAAAVVTLTEAVPVLREKAVLAAIEFARLRASARRPVNAETLDHDLSLALAHDHPQIGRVLITEVSARAI